MAMNDVITAHIFRECIDKSQLRLRWVKQRAQSLGYGYLDIVRFGDAYWLMLANQPLADWVSECLRQWHKLPSALVLYQHDDQLWCAVWQRPHQLQVFTDVEAAIEVWHSNVQQLIWCTSDCAANWLLAPPAKALECELPAPRPLRAINQIGQLECWRRRRQLSALWLLMLLIFAVLASAIYWLTDTPSNALAKVLPTLQVTATAQPNAVSALMRLQKLIMLVQRRFNLWPTEAIWQGHWIVSGQFAYPLPPNYPAPYLRRQLAQRGVTFSVQQQRWRVEWLKPPTAANAAVLALTSMQQSLLSIVENRLNFSQLMTSQLAGLEQQLKTSGFGLKSAQLVRRDGLWQGQLERHSASPNSR
ncbi:hypothetical protein CWI84_04790 [Idiomarina tyrosinivorans]|uniref:Uncharacterized protein n=2 Tax=Idiomarina tyrosinivorans TaxID=1445662 RepID=A0A432ZRC3_9GAMM|nr:hypothetical protein CWI84_04790 [Idiomarina tyrosinivorans]